MKNLCLLFLLLLFTSCTESKFNDTDIHGNWKVASWTVESTGKSIKNKMDMNFSAFEKYTIDYGTENEKGKYWIANDYLHTVEQNEAEKKVLILKLNPDTLQIQMNRAGEMENVTLVKK